MRTLLYSFATGTTILPHDYHVTCIMPLYSGSSHHRSLSFLFFSLPSSQIAAAGTALTSGAWVADLQASFASLAAFWPSDEPPPPPSRAPSRTTRIS
jgi:hypothetical protein